jgi:hypothetical protein
LEKPPLSIAIDLALFKSNNRDIHSPTHAGNGEQSSSLGVIGLVVYGEGTTPYIELVNSFSPSVFSSLMQVAPSRLTP